MNEWLDDFQMMGVKLNEGEKILMRIAIKKERERIIKLLEDAAFQGDPDWDAFVNDAVALIQEGNK